MKSIEADPEDVREIINAAKVIHNALIEKNIPIAYVMEALQGMYAEQASRLVTYERYCETMDFHKEHYKQMWGI